MQFIDWESWTPGGWAPDLVPDVDDARPKRCPRCGKPARCNGRVCLQGHGVRCRDVVAFALTTSFSERAVLCWVRRYRCTECHAVPSVLPRGVLPRYLYSVGAIVAAFLVVEEEPVGDGATEEEAYQHHGSKRRTAWTDASPYRWRSLGRWARRVHSWWPGRAFGTLATLLVSFLERAVSPERARVVEAAVESHVRWGAAM